MCFTICIWDGGVMMPAREKKFIYSKIKRSLEGGGGGR